MGAMGFWGSELLFGVGHEGVELALRGEVALGFMFALVVLKILATSITLGAGGSGGVFAPALFVGAMAEDSFLSIIEGRAPSSMAVSKISLQGREKVIDSSSPSILQS